MDEEVYNNNNNKTKKVYAVGFKGFDSDMKCRGKQYAENTVFTEKGGNICEPGVIHFCEYPLNVFDYYPPVRNGEISTYAQVESLVEPQRREGKCATTKIRIGEKIDFAGLAKAAVDFVSERAKEGRTFNQCAVSTFGPQSAASTSIDMSVADVAGPQSIAGSCGYKSIASAVGGQSIAGTSGDMSIARTAGSWSIAGASGFQSVADNSGDLSIASASGNFSVAHNSGNRGTANASGDLSIASVSGRESFAIATGIEGKAKGALGCYIACAEWSYDDEGNHQVKNFKTAKVDGKKIKPDTLYMLKDGKFVEVGDEQ